MFKHYFERVQDIDIYPVLSLLIFFIFFLVLLIWVVRVDKKYIKEMRQLPLDGSTNKANRYEEDI
jgi:cytochrome c oxidase cbb3-type subunit IV